MSGKENEKSQVKVVGLTYHMIKFCYQRRRKIKDQGSSTRLPSRSGSAIVFRESTGEKEDIGGLVVGSQKEENMADSDGSIVAGSSSVGSSQERGNKNKRKLADHFQPNLAASLTEFPRYEQTSERIQMPLRKLQSSEEARSIKSKENPTGEQQSDEWDEPLVLELEALLSSGLHAIFKDAIWQIVECGYSEDVAKQFLARQAIYCGGEDLVSNIVKGTLATLKKDKKRIDAPREEAFEDLQQMVKFTLLEMVNVLREVKPSLSIAEAMWWLLMSELNISQACTIDDLSSYLDGNKKESEATQSKSDTQSSKMVPTNSSGQHFSNPPTSNTQGSQLKFGSFLNAPKPTGPPTREVDSLNSKAAENVEKSVASVGERIQTMSLAQAPEKRSGTSRKGQGKKSSTFLLQKSLHGPTEKTYKTHGKGAFKSVQLTVEKRAKSLSEVPAVQSKDGDSSKISIEPKVAASTVDKSHSVSEKVDAPKAEDNIHMSPTLPNYYAGIPFDESLEKYVPEDKKDGLILKLVPRLHELQDEANNWTDWANEKVMQATRKLSKELPELRALRKEKQEAELTKKENQALKENAAKRQSEMEVALSNATSQVKKSNSKIRKLDAECSTLKNQMEDAQSLAEKSAAGCREALEREQKAAQRVQEMNRQKELLQEELLTNKKKAAELQQEISKAENLYNQTEARYNRERMETEKYIAQAAAIKKEREELEVAAKAEEDKIRQKAESQKKLYLVNIKQLENRLSLLKYNLDCAKIAALRRSQDGGFGNLTPRSSSSGGLRQDRECVMCLEEEKTVVMLPCAHQVLCVKCNERHEKQGMNDCPSCRTPIQRRINVIIPPRKK